MASTIKNISISVGSWLKEMFYTRRMESWPGFVVMALVGIGLAYTGAVYDIKIPLLIAGSAFGILFLLACFYYPEFAYYAFVYSVILFTLPGRLFNFEVSLGPAIEGTGYLSIIAIMSQQYRKRTNSAAFWKTPTSICIIVIFVFYLLEAVNPEINHQLGGWMSFVRKQVLYLLFYYMSFLMLDSMEKIRRFIKISILIALLVAFWGFKQQYLGFTAYEDGWIHSDPTITQLLFQGGMFRKFSLMSDPVAFGVLVTSMGLLTLVVALRERRKNRRNLYLIFTIILLVSSSYSGTRTCNVMLVSGLLAYIVFTINEKKSIRLLFSSLAIALFLLFGPFKNTPLIYRIRTTFEANKDASNLVRDVNRKRIQPYIYVHPIGGGLNTCGEEGKRFYPEHVLAGYPPDSGYMKIMLDQGWIGLAINIIFYFILLQRGITGFYESTKREIKTIYIALTICLFSLIVGQYSQECIRAYPQILFFYAALVIFYKLKQYDTISSETNETT